MGLKLERKENEELVINGVINIKFVELKAGSCRVLVDAPRDIEIWRKELYVKREAERRNIPAT
jgi:carbon storage regulator